MRHGITGRHFSRSSSHRMAMFRNLVTSLLEHERVYTTIPKAKDLRRIAERMITLGKRGDLHARRQALAYVRTKDVVHKLFAELAPRYQSRPGGYTRIVKAGFREGDAAPMCLIELVVDEVKGKEKAKKPEKKTEKKTEAAKPAAKAKAPEAKPAE